ncbi:MAG: hypothetical protein MK008_01570 [Bdellovibrionales bacterium]|nr:hypothetical protein [Bdellovibrionales bacterium]
MRIASIDMGSNSFLLLIAKVNSLGELKTEFEDIKVVRLGEKVDQTGCFSQEALSRATKALGEFHKTIQAYNVDWTEAVTTSAARRASNFSDLKLITDLLNIPLKVISGEEEAKLTYLGACEVPGAVIVDVGGGSTEVVTERQGSYISHSFEFGSVRLLEKHITQQPIKKTELEALQLDLQRQLQDQKKFLNALKGQPVIAVSGTPTTLAALIKDVDYSPEVIDGLEVTQDQMQHWIDRLSTLSVIERMNFKALKDSPKRADVIVVGIMCLQQTLQAMECNSFKVSTKGVRYGMVKDIYSKHSFVLANK